MVELKASYPTKELYGDLMNLGSGVRSFIRDGILPGFNVFPVILVGILTYHYFTFGKILPSKEDYVTKNIINQEQIFIPDSTSRDSIPDSIFVPKPEPLEGILLE